MWTCDLPGGRLTSRTQLGRTPPPPLAEAAGRVALAVGVGAGAGQGAALDDQVLVADRPGLEEALEDLAGAGGVAGLGRERGAGDVRGHAVVGHGPPRVVGRCRLREPDVARVARQLSRLERGD